MMTLPRGPRDPIHRLLAINGLLGAAVGIGFAIGIYWLDVGHIQRLVANDSGGSVAMILMTAGFVVTCASLAMGSAIMMMPRDDDKDPPQGGAASGNATAGVSPRAGTSAGTASHRDGVVPVRRWLIIMPACLAPALRPFTAAPAGVTEGRGKGAERRSQPHDIFGPVQQLAATRQHLVHRRHGARLIRLVIMQPSIDHTGEANHQPLHAQCTHRPRGRNVRSRQRVAVRVRLQVR